MYNDPGMAGGDANNGVYGDEDDDLDGLLLEPLIVIGLTAALMFIMYYRQYRQQQARRRAEEEQRRLIMLQQMGEQQAAGGLVGGVGLAPPPQAQAPAQDRGVFPPPGDPDVANWAVGGVGH